MTPDEQIAKMTKAIHHAIKILGDRFGSTEGETAKTIQMLKESLLKNIPSQPAPPAPPAETTQTAS